jgi:hypothetical protein
VTARRGAALPFVLGALTIGLAGAAAAAAGARAGLREARGVAAVLQAGAAADGALAAVLAAWPGRWTTALAPGASDWRDVRTPAGPARVRVVRLDAERFAVEAWAASRAGAMPDEAPAERRRMLLVRVAALTPPGVAAVTAAGGVEVATGALVDGTASAPAGWTDCGNAVAAGVAVAAPTLTAAPGTVVGAVHADSAAWAPALAPRLGEVAFAAVRAAVERDAGTFAPQPRAGDGAGDGGTPAGDPAEPCALDGDSWGDPRRGSAAVAACEGAWPVVRLRGPVVRLAGPARFQGTLLVDGDLEVDGLVEGAGTVVVRGAVRAAGSLVLDGALVAGGSVRLGAGSRVRASACATSRAAAYAARASPLARRSWAEVTR